MSGNTSHSGELKRGLKNRHIQLIALGGAIGTGLFLGSAGVLKSAGPSMILGYAICGFIAFMIMRQLGEMIVEEPVAGSFSHFAHKYWGGFAGFMSGWNCWVLYILVGMSELTAVGKYVHYWWPEIPTWASAAAFFVLINLINLTNDATNSLTKTTDYQSKQVELETQLNLISALVNYANNPSNAMQVIPANLGLQNQNLNQSISKYNEGVLLRNRLIKSSSEDNPSVQRITAELEEMWPSIRLSLEAIKNDLQTQKKSADSQFHMFNSRIQSTPTQERALTNIMRQQEIQANLYLMLLQKREENAISLASTAAKARIIDSPQYMGKVAPKSMIIWMIALILGFGFPIGVVLLLNLLRYQIEGREDIEKLTKIPILADIPLGNKVVDGEKALVVRENSNNTMEEAFRGLRTNLRFVQNANEKVICCTSCIPGEGKTFISTNLAMSIALMGKKVIIVGLDIRKPRLVKLFGIPVSKSGLTTFLSSDDMGYDLLESQITHSIGNPNLDVLPAGVIPPNPGELISRTQLDRAIELLKEHYDYIVLDTPPIGLVSDTLSIARVADVTLVVCRADYSPRSNFNLINNLNDNSKLPKVNLVLNGVDLKKKKYGYYYGYGKYGKYGYGYGKYGHYGIYGNYGNQANKEHTEK